MKISFYSIVLFSFVSAYCAGGFSIDGGISKPLGTGSDQVNAGIDLSTSFYGLASDNIGVGGHVGFNNWTYIIPPELTGLDLSLTNLEFLFIMRINCQIGDNSKFFVEPGFGVYDLIANASYMGNSASVSKAYPGFSIDGGFVFGKFEVRPGFKFAFTEGTGTQWFNLTIGFNNEGSRHTVEY